MVYIRTLLLAALACASDDVDASITTLAEIASTTATTNAVEEVTTIVGPYKIIFQVTHADAKTVSPEATDFTATSTTVATPSSSATAIAVASLEGESEGANHKASLSTLRTNGWWYFNKWGWPTGRLF